MDVIDKNIKDLEIKIKELKNFNMDSLDYELGRLYRWNTVGASFKKKVSWSDLNSRNLAA